MTQPTLETVMDTPNWMMDCLLSMDKRLSSIETALGKKSAAEVCIETTRDQCEESLELITSGYAIECLGCKHANFMWVRTDSDVAERLALKCKYADDCLDYDCGRYEPKEEE